MKNIFFALFFMLTGSAVFAQSAPEVSETSTGFEVVFSADDAAEYKLYIIDPVSNEEFLRSEGKLNSEESLTWEKEAGGVYKVSYRMIYEDGTSSAWNDFDPASKSEEAP